MNRWRIIGVLFVLIAGLSFGALTCIVADSGEDMKDYVKEDAISNKEKKNDYMVNPIDWEKLHKTNLDAYAWLFIPGTNINYPIMQASKEKEDDYYLHHDIKGGYSFAGCVYSRKENRKDFSDKLTVLYGHNMLNGSMFGTISKFAEEEFFNKHRVFYIYLQNKVMKYRIVAYMITDDTDILNEYQTNNITGFEAYIERIQKERNIPNKEKLDQDDFIVTLSTCDSRRGKRRLIQGALLETQTTKN